MDDFPGLDDHHLGAHKRVIMEIVGPVTLQNSIDSTTISTGWKTSRVSSKVYQNISKKGERKLEILNSWPKNRGREAHETLEFAKQSRLTHGKQLEKDL